ncbi:hypothetical protein N0V93_009901 [Gnomoniopsis smithogilvyi]|uniref:Uncharacterized protein n=1 Tax=Gnomoniopsis smithogilvyi TaxID=1191159 RepID=A0A9W8YKY6_9PEZI|nr:hypothetical protein N0V93_009901 [Gnomoniopsis smithogilvyi]
MSSSIDSGSGSGSGSGSDASSEDGLVFPEDFPVDLRVYDQDQFDNYRPPVPPQADPNDPRRRDFDSLYPLDWLVATPAANNAASTYPPAPIGRLRTKWQQAFQQAANGEWKYVEYVPAWSDPDWTSRYAWTQDVSIADMDQVARQYVKPGMLQTQRPALRPSDASLNPTEAAKRWGIYPWHTRDGLDGLDSFKGWSGVTPRTPGFPVVQLQQPRFSQDAGGLVTVVTVDDLASERQRFEDWRRHHGLETNDEDFRQSLHDVSLDPTAGPIRTEKAASLLAILDVLERTEEREEYQRLLFSGSTTNELVEQGAWTLGADAVTDLNNPLHELVSRDKWARTESWGSRENRPRVVYNLSGKQGEYTAHDDTMWNALQPALQLVSQVLNSQHPATLVWADVRKLRPVEDSRGATGSRHSWKFYTSPDHDVDVEKLTGLVANWDDFVAICASGFDTTRYACEILKRTIEWSIKSQWRVCGEHNNVAATDRSASAYGATTLGRVLNPASTTPFKIQISIAAEMLWPLLVDEYSPAEKAASTTYVAVTMLHEISHALALAQFQMFMPGTCNRGDEPLWLLLDPSWPQEIVNFNAQQDVDILHALQTFGGRMQYTKSSFEDYGLFFPIHELYWETDPAAEEGWATEHQYFGGVFEVLPSASAGSFPNLDNFRFLEEATYIAAMRGWATDMGCEGRFQLLGALAMSEYQKMYSQGWWRADFATYGLAAMKMYHASSPIRGTLNLRTLHVTIVWDLAGLRYGNDAHDWLFRLWLRVKDETENQFLWRYLLYQTIVATEAEACDQAWFYIQEHWDFTDLSVWTDRCATNDRGAEFAAALNRLSDLNTDDVYYWNVERPVSEFRRFSAALWHMQSVLSREATYFQHVAVSFIGLEDRAAKAELFRLYAWRIRTRISDLYVKICIDISQSLDEFDNLATTRPNITSWLTSSPDIARIWERDAIELRQRLRIISEYFSVVLGVFSEDPTQQKITVDQLGAVPSGAARTVAARVKRIAMREYHALAPTDPRKKAADDWSQILKNGDLLCNPPPNSPAARFNQQLHNRVVNIDAGVAAHQQAVANSHPDPQMPRHIVDSPALLVQQAHSAAERSDRTRTLIGDGEAAFSAPSGFQPYSDTTTGYTSFADMRGYQPSLRHHQQTTPMSPQQQNQQEPGAFPNSFGS